MALFPLLFLLPTDSAAAAAAAPPKPPMIRMPNAKISFYTVTKKTTHLLHPVPCGRREASCMYQLVSPRATRNQKQTPRYTVPSPFLQFPRTKSMQHIHLPQTPPKSPWYTNLQIPPTISPTLLPSATDRKPGRSLGRDVPNPGH